MSLTEGTLMRESLLAALRVRIMSLRSGADPKYALGADGAAEVRRLLDLVGDPAGDLEVAHTVGLFHLFRWLVPAGHRTDEDLRTAVILLALVHRVTPQTVPEPLRTWLTRNPGVVADPPPPGGNGPWHWMEQVRALFDDDQESDPGGPAEGVGLLRSAVTGVTPEHPEYPTRVNDLGYTLRMLAGATGDPAPLREAEQVWRRAVAAVPADHPEHGGLLSGLATCLRTIFWMTGDLGALTEAVEAARRALAAAPPGHDRHAGRLAQLGAALQTLFERTGDTDALREAVEKGAGAVAATMPGDPGRGGFLTELGAALRLSFRVGGNPADLAEAVRAHREAVAELSPGDQYHIRAVRDLGNVLLISSLHGGGPGETAEAIRMLRQAAELTPSGPERGASLRDLGAALLTLFERTGDADALREAAQACRSALAATPPEHSAYASYAGMLGSALAMLFARTGDADALREAAQACRSALAATPPEHSNHVVYEHLLGMTLLDLFLRTDDRRAGEEALSLLRRSVTATTPEDTSHSAYAADLGTALGKISDRTGDLGTLQEAIEVYRNLLAVTPADHPLHGRCTFLLAHARWSFFRRTGDLAARDEAGTLYAQAAASTAVPAPMRLNAMRAVASSVASAGDLPAALAVIEGAVALLPLLSGRRLSWPDREYGLSRAAWLPGEAAAIAIGAGRPDRAMELLEQTRGVLLAETMGARGDLSDLHAHAPGLAAEFVRLRDELEAMDRFSARHAGFGPGGAFTAGVGPGAEEPGASDGADPKEAVFRHAERRRQLAEEWDDLLTRIHAVPGLAGFLLPPSIDELRRQAADGPVVIVNTSTLRCDALLLTADADRPLRLLELPRVTLDSVLEQVDRFQSALARSSGSAAERLRAQREVRTVLGWLWDEIAGPVLTELGLGGPAEPGASPPRLWWCPIGELAFLPLHAAGHHGRAGGDEGQGGQTAVLDRVVSSYTPSLRVLAYAREAAEEDPAGPDVTTERGALIIAMPETPGDGVPPLPGARDEARRLAELLPGSRTLSGPDADRDAVLAALPRHSFAHLACHGISDAEDPAASRLLLHDHETRPLTVRAVAGLRLTHAELAFLSACGTTQTSQRLADQAVHITAAFQLAGYKHVIGTLWTVDDRIALRVADQVYSRLTSGGKTEPQIEQVAHALHEAIRRLRDDYPASPVLWATHIHAGI